ncbi:MAG TPA: efflux RND transporter periplasmic adaptor subunit, partial [Polyangiaceae bacterium]|nr:efflux RND transporter periplasmic adaptor subunit [Polyangiaceae bacterium]
TTSVDETQAADLSLTTTPAAEQSIQTWVRTSAMMDNSGKTLTAELNAREGALVQVGQRARAYQVSSRASMYQAKITRVTPKANGVIVEATLPTEGRDGQAPYLLEIVVDRGRFLAVPNAAIIEEGDTHVVYVQHHPGHYVPTEVHTGLQGELYTQVLHGLEGGEQVVTFGSFFVDAQHKLKDSGGDAAMGHEHHHH